MIKIAIKEAQKRCYDAMRAGDLASQVREYERIERLEKIEKLLRSARHEIRMRTA